MKQNENKIKEEKKLEKVTGGANWCTLLPVGNVFMRPDNKQNNEKPTVGEKNRKMAK